MNKSKRRSRNIAILCIVIGVVLLGIGLGLGGNVHSGWGVNFKDNFGIFGGDNHKEQTHSLDDFDSIQIDVAVGDIEIQQGDAFELVVKGYDEDSYDFDVVDREFQLSYEHPFAIFNLNFDFVNDKKITIYVPKDIELENVFIDSSMGDVGVYNLTCKDLDINQAMGDVDVEGLLVDGDTNIDQKMGDIAFLGELKGTTYIDQKMGDITFIGELKGKSEFHNAMGDTEITILASAHEYRYELKTSLGAIRLSDAKQSEKSDSALKGGGSDAPYEIYSKNAMGDIELEFDEK